MFYFLAEKSPPCDRAADRSAYADMYETSTDFSRLGYSTQTQTHEHAQQHHQTCRSTENTTLSFCRRGVASESSSNPAALAQTQTVRCKVKRETDPTARQCMLCAGASVPACAQLTDISHRRYILCMCFSTSYASEENMFGEHTDSYAPYMWRWHLMRSSSERASRVVRCRYWRLQIAGWQSKHVACVVPLRIFSALFFPSILGSIVVSICGRMDRSGWPTWCAYV